MKSEIQIIVRCKQPIKIEKPLQSLLTLPYIAGERNIVQTVLLSYFECLFSFALQSDKNSNRVNVLGHKYILGPSHSSF